MLAAIDMKITDALEWRYACKKMNGLAVPQSKIDLILNSIKLAPTSLGLQPFTVFQITDKDLKNKILPIANQQSQVVDCSHLLVFAAWTNIPSDKLEQYVQLVASTRQLSDEKVLNFRNMLNNFIGKNSPEANFQWAARQTYIALGFAMAAAATEQVDSTPMEGFKSDELDALLGLTKKGMKSVCMLPLGYRDEANDWLLKFPKVRRPLEQLVISVDH
jgi:nitroreductase